GPPLRTNQQSRPSLWAVQARELAALSGLRASAVRAGAACAIRVLLRKRDDWRGHPNHQSGIVPDRWLTCWPPIHSSGLGATGAAAKRVAYGDLVGLCVGCQRSRRGHPRGAESAIRTV